MKSPKNLFSYICNAASFCLLFCFFSFSQYSYSQLPKPTAFPGAEGFGKYATGGRGGAVIKVTNLNDSGPGSLRQALEFTSGPRTVIFEVGGTITLKSVLRVKGGNITIAGQTAPGGGILIKDGQLLVESSNVIIRHLRFRYGTKSSSYDDSFSITAWRSDIVENIVVDHCSMSWGKDENFNVRVVTKGTVRNITLQNSIVSEGGKSLLLYGPRVYNISLFENLLANNRERNIRSDYPSDSKFDFEMVNNIIHGFSWGTVPSTGSKFAVINNIYKKSSEIEIRGAAVEVVAAGGIEESFTDAYISGNIVSSGIKLYKPNLAPYLKTVPFSSSGIVARPADQIVDIIPHVGASLPKRDAVDERIIQQYKNGNGGLKYVGTYPVIPGGKALTDTDNDGMPDFWEIANGLNPNDTKDRNYVQPDGYTNLEYYLNGMSLKTTTVTANAGDDVEICKGSSTTLTATGGKTYLWNNGEKTANITVSPDKTTTYIVTAYDASGKNSDTDEVTVTVNLLPKVNAGPDKTITAGETVTLTATGADSYKWSTGETTASITVSPMSDTSYNVIGKTGDCEASDSVTVFSIKASVTANAGRDTEICKGNTVTLTATGGSSYHWNTGQTSASINVSPSKTTTYSVTAYDASGKNSDTDEVTVTVNPLPEVSAGDDVQINLGETVALSATGASSYNWDNGATGAKINVSPKSTQTYTVTGIKNGCEATASVKVTVLQPVVVVADAGEDQQICQGTTATLTARGGATYLWSNGETSASIEVNPSETTVYTVTAYDTTGKNSDTDEVTVTVNPMPTVDAGKDVTIAYGETIELTATGADSYIWSNGATGAVIKVSPKTTRTYKVTGTSNGCEATASVKVTVKKPAEIVADAGEDQKICRGTTATLTASGGATYLWSNGETSASIEVNPSETTVYTVTAYDATGKNSATDEVKVTVNPMPKVNAGQDVTIAYGETIELTATGADGYIWSNGATGAVIKVSPKTTRTYKVTGTSNGCEATASVKVSVQKPAEIVADAGEDQQICQGTTATLTANGGASYLWSNGETSASIEVNPSETTVYTVNAYDATGKNSATDEVTVTVNPMPTVDAGKDVTIAYGESVELTATGADSYIWSNGATGAVIKVSPKTTRTYRVTGTSNGCEATASVKVTVQKPAEIVADAGEDQQICQGTTATLTASGGTTYLWSNGETSASIEVNPSETTVYTVTAYDATGKNSATDEVKVTVNPMPKVNAGQDVTIAYGETIELTATGADGYIWSNGSTGAVIKVSPKTTRTYKVTGTSNGCEAIATIKVTVQKPTEIVADAGEDQQICQGTSATLTASGGATYLWSNGETSASIEVNPSETTVYTVTAYNATGKNSATDEVTVTVNPMPKVNAGKDITIVYGESVELKASGAIDYKWSNGETGAVINVSPKSTQTFTVFGMSNGCEATAKVTVTVRNPDKVLIANAGDDQQICQGTTATLTASGGVTYSWSNGETSASIEVNPSETTVFTVIAYDTTGKNSDTDEVIVTVNQMPKVNAGKDVTISSGETVELTATGAKDYKWSNGETGAVIKVSPEATQTFMVTGFSNGCEATAKVRVIVRNSIKVVANAGQDQEICQGSTVKLTATGGDTYLWNTGETTASIAVRPSSTTKYTVTAFVGKASDKSSVTVNVNPNPNVEIANGPEASILEGEYITLSATGAKTYKWSNGAVKPNIAVRPNATSNYEVVGFNTNKCASAKKAIKVNVFEKVVASAGNDVSICRNEKTVLTAGGPKNSEYLWSTGETSKSITVSPEEDTEYSVMVYHKLDSDTAKVFVSVNSCGNDAQLVEEPVSALEFLVYPNPTDGDVNIKISGLKSISSIHLYDLSGKSLFQESISDGERQSYIKTLDLSDYASGIYLLQLIDNDRVITKKIVLK